jgi:integrase
MANVVERNGSYKITVSGGYTSDGKQKRSVTTWTPPAGLTGKKLEKALNEAVVDFERKVKSGKVLDGEKMTYSEYIRGHWMPFAEKKLAVTTFESDVGELERYILPELGELKLSQIKPLHLIKLYDALSERGLSAGTVRRVHSTVSSTLGYACKWGLCESNVALKADPPAKKKDPAALMCFDVEQTRAFLAYLDEPYIVTFPGRKRKDGSRGPARSETHTVPLQQKCLFHIAVIAGSRRGEVLGLTWDSVDFKNNAISITKAAARTKRGPVTKDPKNKPSCRIVALPPTVMDMLKRLRKEQKEYRLAIGSAWQGDNWLFIQANGKRMCLTTANHSLHKIIDRYNALHPKKPLPKLPLNSLRHTSATVSIAAGMDVKSVSARLGHSQTSTTLNVYSHALQARDAQIAQALEDTLLSKNA